MRVFLIFLLAVLTLQAQQPKVCEVSGQVDDEVGILTPNVPVLLIDLKTLETRTALTNSTGTFQFKNLPAGDYEIIASGSKIDPCLRTRLKRFRLSNGDKKRI